ncbi:MAG: c-type cytochrome [Alphaproteobacteria bacterium]
MSKYRKLELIIVALSACLFSLPLFSENVDQASLERGEYLVRGPAGCGNCHTPFGPNGPDQEKELTGRLVEKVDIMTAYAPNLTPGSHIKNWSDAELSRAIREGIRPDGSLIGPPMPFLAYRGLSDVDVQSMVMFLRTLPAIKNDVPKSTYNFSLPPAYGPPVGKVPHPKKGLNVEYGEYLAFNVAHCMECHTPMGPKGRMYDTHMGLGGFEFHGPWGVSVAPNIRNTPEGIADYSDEALREIITKGRKPDGTRMFPPMPYGYLASMTDMDLDAIILYLRSLK